MDHTASEPDFHTVRRRPRQERSRQLFEAIVASTRALIAKRGLAPITMTDIAAEAGVSVTAVYRYFPNKQAVVRELALRIFETDAAIAEAFGAGDRDAPPEVLIARDMETYCRFHLEDAVRLQIRAAIQADAELSELDLIDSRSHAAIVADRLELAGVVEPREVLERRALLLVEMVGSVIRLAHRVEPDEADDIVAEFVRTASCLLLGSDAATAPTTTVASTSRDR